VILSVFIFFFLLPLLDIAIEGARIKTWSSVYCLHPNPFWISIYDHPHILLSIINIKVTDMNEDRWRRKRYIQMASVTCLL
jgi:hypothetical protein